jgi:CheY-like chemotaxis protein
MDKPIKSILLVDDDEATNFLHKIIIKDAGCSEYVHVANNGKRAIEYLSSVTGGKYPQPDLIFLDINMPVMDGWEFLEAYQELPEDQRAKMVLVMLTSSLNPDDDIKARGYKEVSGFRNKPLTVGILDEIINEYFKSEIA